MSDLKLVNDEVFDKNSELLKGINFGTPWVETLMIYIRKTGFSGSGNKLLIEVASNFEEMEDESRVIYDGVFKACRLPSLIESNKAVELCKPRNVLSSLIKNEMRENGVNFINGLIRESMEKIIDMIDFEISSLPVFLFLLGFQYIDNRGNDEVYGVSSSGEVSRVTESNVVYSVSTSELCGINNSVFDLSQLF